MNSTAFDPRRCPLCGAANACAVQAARDAGAADPAAAVAQCWCAAAPVPPAVLVRVPDGARGRACVCPACARAPP